MTITRLMLFTTLFIAFMFTTYANSEPRPLEWSSEILNQSSNGWDGLPFAYPNGTPQITIKRLVLPSGFVLPMHCHPMPVVGYMLQGELEVTKPSGESTRYLENQGKIEVFREWHEGVAIKDSEMIVVYAGAQGMPLSVPKKADQPNAAGCRSPADTE